MATIDELIKQKPKNRKEAETLVADINKKIAEVQAVRPTGAPGAQQYLVEGVRLTQRGYDARIKNLRDRLTYVTTYYITNDPFATQQSSRANQLYPQYNQWRSEIRSDLQVLRDARKKARTVDEQENLDLWIRDTEKRLAQFDEVLPQLASGVVPSNLPPNYVAVNLNKAKAEPPFGASPAAAREPAPTTTNISNITTKEQARAEIARLRERANNLKGLVGEKSGNTVLYYEAPGQPGMSKGQRDSILAGVEARIDALNNKFFAETPVSSTAPAAPEVAPTPGVTQPSPLTAGQRGEAGINQGAGRPAVTFAPETPVVETPAVTTAPGATPTPGTTTMPGTTPTPDAPQYTPGQEIGGPDRVLPDGGAVVEGRYIPPGIDFTWLADQAPEDWKQAARELYGAYYDMIKNDPEISKLLEDAITNGYSDAQFQAKLEQTNWWRTTSANARQFELLEGTDPATARTQLDNRIALVRETAQRMGVTLGAESLESIARNAINLGFELTAQVEDLVGSEAIRSSGGMSQLRFGYVGNSIRESARKFGVALSDTTFNEWVNKIAVGAESAETFESYAQQIARNLYPSLVDGFDRGLSFGEMTDPYAQVASRILEIPSSQVDFTDPKWAQAITGTNDKGEPTQMSFGDWAKYLRTDARFGWEYTDDAKNRAYTVANRMAELFGAA